MITLLGLLIVSNGLALALFGKLQLEQARADSMRRDDDKVWRVK